MSYPLNAGELTQRVTLQAPGAARDAAGQRLPGQWQTLRTVWASVEPLRGRERQAAGAAGHEVDVRVTIYWADDLEPLSAAWRLLHGTRVYNVQSVSHVAHSRERIEIMAREQAPVAA